MEAELATAASARYCPACETLTAARECPHDGMPTVPGTQFHEVGDGAPGRILNGRYRLGPRLAEGGMGRIYLARQLAMDRPVAIKLLRPELLRDKRAVQRFYREARAASQLTGRHFVRVHDFGFDEDFGAPFLAMELLEGPTLADLGAVPPRRAAALLAQVADALVEAERHHIVHRDLKAANILLSVDAAGRDLVKVTDFGVAKRLDDVDPGLTQTGAPVGTPSCMAPEQIRGHAVDLRTDLYALGCLLHRLLTGVRVFEAEQLDVLMHQHLVEAPPRLPALLLCGEPVPPALAQLRDALLAKRPEDRPGDAARVRDLLAAVADGEGDTLDVPRALGLAALATTTLTAASAELELDTWRGADPSSLAPTEAPAEDGDLPDAAAVVTPRGGARLGRWLWPWVSAAAAAGAVFAVVLGVTAAGTPTLKASSTLARSAAPSPVAASGVPAPGRGDGPAQTIDAATPRTVDVPPGAIVVSPTAPAPTVVAAAPPAATAVMTPAAPAPTVIATRTVVIDSKPTAFLYRDGVPLGRTPYTLELAADFASFEVELRGKGYARKRVVISPGGPTAHRFTLDRLRDGPTEDPDRRPRLHL